EAEIKNKSRRDQHVLVALAPNAGWLQLSFQLALVGDRGIRSVEGAIGESGAYHGQEEKDSNHPAEIGGRGLAVERIAVCGHKAHPGVVRARRGLRSALQHATRLLK